MDIYRGCSTYLRCLFFVYLQFTFLKSECVDSSSNCDALAAAGECSSTTTAVTCKKACNNCHLPDCSDFHTSCAAWASSGECSNNPGYMLVACKLSCLVCSPTDSTTAQSTTEITTAQSTSETTTAQPTTEITTVQPTTETTTAQPTTETTTAQPATEITTTETTTVQPSIETTADAAMTTVTQMAENVACCTRHCNGISYTPNITDVEVVRAFMEQIKAELLMNKTSLSSFKRSKVCAEDDRKSAVVIGWVGGVFLGIVFGSLVACDCINIFCH